MDAMLIPGDVVNTDLLNIKQSRLTCGPGLTKENDLVTSCKAGVLKHKADSSIVWVDSHQKRYVATKGDNVIGIVTAKQGDFFRIDIGTSSPASLSYLSFEGSTKKNRPDVKVGDIIYGKLLVANRHMEPELVCIDGNGKSNGMGVIRDGGNLVHVSLQLSRRLVSKQQSPLTIIGELIPYEIAVGMNGRIWIKGRSLDETLAICNIVKEMHKIPAAKMSTYISRTINSLLGTKQ